MIFFKCSISQFRFGLMRKRGKADRCISVFVIERAVLQKHGPASSMRQNAEREKSANSCGSKSATEKSCTIVFIIFRKGILRFQHPLHLHHVSDGKTLGRRCLVKPLFNKPPVLEIALHFIEGDTAMLKETVNKHAVVFVHHRRNAIEGRKPSHGIFVGRAESQAVTLLTLCRTERKEEKSE